MEKNKERVLAYQLAKQLETDEMEQVSGGNAGMSIKRHLKITGGSGSGADVTFDVSWDW